jgi:hypothetical protein
MPHEINAEIRASGYALGDAAQGEIATVVLMDFNVIENGELFVQRLEGFPQLVLNAIPEQSRCLPSQVDNMLAIFPKKGTVTVYLNELEKEALICPKRDIPAGGLIYKDDLAQIARLRFKGDIQIPDDAGFFYLFSEGWRKGFFFDFTPLAPQGKKRNYDLEKLFAAMHNYLLFQEVFKATDAEWQVLLEHGWFPFIALKSATVARMFWSGRTGKSFDELAELVASEFEPQIDTQLVVWKNNKLAENQRSSLELAVKHYKQGDFASACSVIYPQIEGLMRSFFSAQGLSGKRSQSALVDSTIKLHAESTHGFSLLLPERFKTFLTDYFFSDFDPDKPEGVSRNTIGHGVAKFEELDKVAALRGFLLVDQIIYYMRVESEPTPPSE